MSSFSINRVVLVGRLTRECELRALPSGRSVTTMRVACNYSHLDAEGIRTERPNYFDVTVFGASADSVARYTKRGSRVGIDGRLEWREWETAEQERRQAVGIVADVVQFLDSPPGRSHDEDEPAGGDEGELVGVGAEDLEATF
jgi:single-strand DNA-binding protein